MPDLASTIVEYCKNLKHLRIHNPDDLMNETALKKLTELEKLESLILLPRIKLNTESIIAISNNCKKLKRLEIPSCVILPSVNDDFEDSTITAIANNCKNLKSLDIQGSTGLTETALVALSNLENSQKLDVSYLDKITDSSLIKLKRLKELHCAMTFSNSIWYYSIEKISVWYMNNITIDMVIGADQTTKNRTNVLSFNNNSFDYLSVLDELSKLQCLERLNLCFAQDLKDSTITAIANNCKNLKSLDIQGSTGLTETALVALSNLENLQKLDVSYLDIITDSFLIKLKGLKELYCNKCTNLTDVGIIQFIKNNPDLELLSVYCINNITFDMIIAADQATKNLCAKWKEACQLAWYDIKKYKCKSSIGRCYDNCLLTQSYLEKILLRCVSSIDGEPLSSPSVLDELSKLQYLEHLNLRNSENLKDSTITAIANNCKNLKSLEIELCAGITETALVGLTNLKNLQKLNVNRLDIITDSFLIKLKGLKELHCDKCKQLTNAGIIQFIKNNPDLEFLDVCSTDNITINMTVQRFRNLKKLTLVGLCLDKINLQEIADITTLVYLHIGLYKDIHQNLSLFNKLVNLEYIDLTMRLKYNLYELSTKELETIFCTCKNLKHLDIPARPYDVARVPPEKWINFQNLEYLGIYCRLMPDLANTILTELENLECLILFGLFDIMELDNESIIAISNNCKKLKRLEILGCAIVPSIDGEPLSSLSVLDELSKLQYLEHLNLSYVRNLKDSTITAIANNCKNLKSLSIQICRDLTETALVALLNLENLQKLDVSSLDIITDSFLIKLKGLKELHCNGCKKLTNAGIIQFIKNNPDLEILVAYRIDNITIDMIIAADQATKNRTNGIILHIMMDNIIGQLFLPHLCLFHIPT
ncbi:putative adenylate cyclase regulatory protein [Aphidius gifuensis]|uniref:putative adenylate cyclase regulatory protein n=1 Tax=Aphidius gifuensis TaxID=684658 RepID=UPI001CDC3ECF|nr:putative adenylate cyclase regulatory protein [Aphidius gifuensis]